jgi:hypothetical protein
MSGSAASPNVIAQLVETMRTLAGPHPGFRPVLAFRVAVPTRMAPLPVSVRSDSMAEQDGFEPPVLVVRSEPAISCQYSFLR